MLTETLLDHAPLGLLYLFTATLLLVGSELGFRLGTRPKAITPEGEKTPANAIVGSTLGLLAFMLAFTFGMSGSRFDARRQLVLEEASAVLRTHQRAQFLPDLQQTACSRLLREYVGLRLTLPQLASLEAMEEVILKSESLQDALQSEAAALSDQPNAILAGFMQALSELTDLQMRRVRATVWNRIPASILTTLYLVAFLALTAMAYAAGLAGSRTTLPTLMLVLALAAVMVLIVDLERPRQRLFRVSQEPMAEVARRLPGVEP